MLGSGRGPRLSEQPLLLTTATSSTSQSEETQDDQNKNRTCPRDQIPHDRVKTSSVSLPPQKRVNRYKDNVVHARIELSKVGSSSDSNSHLSNTSKDVETSAFLRSDGHSGRYKSGITAEGQDKKSRSGTGKHGTIGTLDGFGLDQASRALEEVGRLKAFSMRFHPKSFFLILMHHLLLVNAIIFLTEPDQHCRFWFGFSRWRRYYFCIDYLEPVELGIILGLHVVLYFIFLKADQILGEMEWFSKSKLVKNYLNVVLILLVLGELLSVVFYFAGVFEGVGVSHNSTAFE